MKKTAFAIEVIALILIAFVLVGITLNSPIKLAHAAAIFTDGFETGDYSLWTGTVNNTGSTMKISTVNKFTGSYAANCLISNVTGTYAYAYHNFSAESILYHREYVKISALPPSGGSCDLFGIMDVHATGEHLGTIAIDNNGTNYRWVIKYYDNTVASLAYSTAVNIKADTWYYIEIMVKSGNGNGQVAVWIAEDLVNIAETSPTINLTNLINNDRPIQTIFFGGYVPGVFPVNIFSDDVVASTTWTGPRDFTSPTVGTISASSSSVGAQVTLSTLVADDVAVDYVVPSWNNTGTWVNQTAINAGGSASYTANFSGTWNSTPGTVVCAIFYANDTSNNWVFGCFVD